MRAGILAGLWIASILIGAGVAYIAASSTPVSTTTLRSTSTVTVTSTNSFCGNSTKCQSIEFLRFHKDNLTGQGDIELVNFTASYPGYLRLSGTSGGSIISYVKVYDSFTGRNDSAELFGPFDALFAVTPGVVKIYLTWQYYGNLYSPGEVTMNGTYFH